MAKARKRLGTYSKGMLQRIGLAETIHDPGWWTNQPQVSTRQSREIRDLILILDGVESLCCSPLICRASSEICDQSAFSPTAAYARRTSQELIAIENQTGCHTDASPRPWKG
jgi:hypothetical protein